MAVRPIVTDSRLRRRAKPVRPYQDISGLVRDLRDTMEASGGVGIAAPQIGVPLAVCIVQDTVYVNPTIVRASEGWDLMTEGCLSLPGYVADVWRHVTVRVRAQDVNRHWFRSTLEDWSARVIQHEVSHLEGRLITNDKFENWRKEEV